ncbi:hypothetical protein HYU14_05685 [Candidatus Woesearchaeota archaeon]|nr:hypothetical protein [Candidatus Woesearchaeota archaeon]
MLEKICLQARLGLRYLDGKKLREDWDRVGWQYFREREHEILSRWQDRILLGIDKSWTSLPGHTIRMLTIRSLWFESQWEELFHARGQDGNGRGFACINGSKKEIIPEPHLSPFGNGEDSMVVFVHPGYAFAHPCHQPPEVTQRLERYNDYLGNIRELMEYLGGKGYPPMRFIEEDVFFEIEHHKSLFLPGNGEICLITKNQCAVLAEKPDHPSFRQESIFPYLAANGIKHVYLSGEFVYRVAQIPVDNPITRSCLGVVYDRFMGEGFDVRLVQGAVFPSTPPHEAPLGYWASQYQKAIPLDELLKVIG